MLLMYFVRRLPIIPTDPLYNSTHRKHNEHARHIAPPRFYFVLPPTSIAHRRAPIALALAPCPDAAR